MLSNILMIIIFLFYINSLIHPINLMIMMIFLNILIFINLSTWKPNFMYSIMMFLIMISGLMIIFMYFSSLTPNELMIKFIRMKPILLIFSIFLYSYIYMNMFNKNWILMNHFNYSNAADMSPTNDMILNIFNNIKIIYYYPFNIFTMICILFLLTAFLTIIKINSSSNSMKLRKITN